LRAKKKRWRLLLVLLMIGAVLCLLAGCGTQNGDDTITSLEQLNETGRHIGVATDTDEDQLVQQELPRAQVEYMKDSISAYASVSQGKLDAFVYSVRTMETAIRNGLKGVRILDATLGEGNKVAVGISPVTKIPDFKEKIDAFIGEIKADGTLDDMNSRWLEEHNETMPEIPAAENPELTLVVGTVGNEMPYSYYAGDELTGREIELARRFAAWLGAELEFKVYDYEGIIAGALSGDVDCIMADLYITPEREESITFSEPIQVEEIGVMVRDTGVTETDDKESSGAAISELSELEDKRIGVTTGSIQERLVMERFPDAELLYYNNSVDMVNALRANKIEAFCEAEAHVRYMMTQNDDLICLDDFLGEIVQVGAVFPKTDEGQALCDEFSEFVREIRSNGVYEEIQEIWFGKEEDKRVVPDFATLPATKGTLRMAADTALAPFVYIKDGKPVGIDVDTVYRFCEEYGYGLEIIPMDFSGIIPAVVTGKVDFSLSGIAYTEERAQSVLYSEPTFESKSVMAVLDNSGAAAGGGFIEAVRDSFYRTFIREDRWKLFLQGIGTTLLITGLSILFGTLLGFFVFMLCRNGNRVANTITRFCVWLVQGMPVVVLLMILYYIIFGGVAISGTAVSVIAFTLVFGAGVINSLKTGVGAVDSGQQEAAYSLGYTNRRAFFRVILPQAMPHFMPSYKGQITEIIKASAVVGYVAVQDLTKMADIIRSRTYEAFFPLIAVAVIYFVLAAVLILIVNRIEPRIDPRKRKPEDIRKEVEAP